VRACLERAAAAGAQLLVPLTPIGEQGFFAVISDLEGNHIGLHSLSR
jgi:uncharacterized protein